MTDFQTEKTHTARIPHRCVFCRCTIPAGTKYVKLAGRWMGDFYSGKGHPDCRELWNALYADWSDPWEGMAWDIPEVLGDSGDMYAMQEALDTQRGFLPHAVNRVEFRLRYWLDGGDA
jgi:hypothetical protein